MLERIRMLYIYTHTHHETKQELLKMEMSKQQFKHFVLVHGACHGAWSWYKLQVRLESTGHRVTVLDLSASGINLKTLNEVRTLYDYTLPLLDFMASLPPKEKVIVVGHSLGGMNLALVMDKYPQKISVAVFLAAFMPDTTHRPSYVLEQYSERMPDGGWLDTQFSSYGSPSKPITSMFFGPKFMSDKLYQQCSAEDLALGMSLIRPGSFFVEDLSKEQNLTDEGYGSVTRVYVECSEDKGIPEEFRHWMIENYPVKEVMEIKGADHMAMFSKPQELCHCLLEIAHKYT
uniref:Putative salicylic acid-binding protein 2 n=1 Tax=Davidia involucrata TaxID=16924 RepID=A0A5B6Z0N3_DAVIN